MIYVIGFIIAILFVLFICGNYPQLYTERMVGFVNNKNRFSTRYDKPIFGENMMYNQSMDNLENLSNMVDLPISYTCSKGNNLWNMYTNKKEDLSNMVDLPISYTCSKGNNPWNIYTKKDERFYNPSFSQQLMGISDNLETSGEKYKQGVANFLLGNMKGLHIGTDYVTPRRRCMRFFGPDGDYQGHNVTYHDELREHDLRKLFNIAMSNKYEVKGVPTYNKQYCNPRLADAFKYCQMDGACINNLMTNSGCFFGYM